MIVEENETGKPIEVYGTREQLIGEEKKTEFLIYKTDENVWEWVDATNYHPIIPEGTK